MALEDGGRDEGLLAQVALVLLVAVVHHLDVHVERVLALEGGVALVALERPLTCGERAASLSTKASPGLNLLLFLFFFFFFPNRAGTI